MQKLKKQLLIWLAVFLTLSLPFWIFSDLDINLIKPYYDDELGFFLKTKPFWDFLYTYGIFLAYILVAVAFFVIALSYWKSRMFKWRKPAVFLILVMFLGPGVLVNATFKDHWGRPRPREITEFGGKHEYVKLWVKGDTNGKSFPSGHASTAFFMAMPFLFLVQRHKKWAWAFLIFGTLYGILMGFTRLIAGGHFASDSLWACAMVWFAGIISFNLLKLDKHFEKCNTVVTLPRKGFSFISFGVVMPILILLLLVATPYVSKNKDWSPNNGYKNTTSVLLADLNKGDVNVHFADSFAVNYSVIAFGFPNSKVNWTWLSADTSVFSFANLGLLTSVTTNADLYFDKYSNVKNMVNLNKGDVYIYLPSDTLTKSLTVNVTKGDVFVLAKPNAQCNLQTSAEVKVSEQVSTLYHNDSSAFTLNVNLQEGQVFIRND